MRRLTLPHRLRRWAIRNARVPVSVLDGTGAPPGPDGLIALDLIVDGDRIEAIGPALALDADLPFVEAAGRIVLPSPVDAHTHLDKGHITVRDEANPDGTLRRCAGDAVDRPTVRKHTGPRPRMLRARMEFCPPECLRPRHRPGDPNPSSIQPPPATSVSHGRSFAETAPSRGGARIDLQAVADRSASTPFSMTNRIRRTNIAGHVVGRAQRRDPRRRYLPGLRRSRTPGARSACNPGCVPANRGLRSGLSTSTRPATLRPTRFASIADIGAPHHRFPGRIVAGHCCSLVGDAQDEAEAAAPPWIAWPEAGHRGRVAADVQHVPAGPRWRAHHRALARVHRAARTQSSRRRRQRDGRFSDNTRDPFYAYGDLDMLEVWREAVTRILHLDHPFATGRRRSPRRRAASAIGLPRSRGHRGRARPPTCPVPGAHDSPNCSSRSPSRPHRVARSGQGHRHATRPPIADLDASRRITRHDGAPIDIAA